ncbi:MAG: kinase [Haloplasmataceae bacterium]|nr:kinase [Haloplasmataceae bacterium]
MTKHHNGGIMKYSIISRGDPFSASIVVELHEKLGLINLINDQDNPNIVITVGGDGTMLKAVHQYLDIIDQVVFIGVHTGKLGFYTDFTHENVDLLIEQIKNDEYIDIKFPLLSANVWTNSICEQYYALNEITLINAFHTQHLDVFINDEYFESFQGTGLCVSTPTGSSAYNKSLGGALLHPNLQAFQLTEIGSINNNVYRTISAPMIFPKEQSIILKSKDSYEVSLTVDHEHQTLKGYDEIRCTLSDKSVVFRQFIEKDFWKRIQKSFL